LGILPHLSVILLSLAGRWQESILPQEYTFAFYARALRDELAATGLQNSLILAFCATFLDVILGFGIAWLCVRSRLRGAWLLDGLAMLPLAVPGLLLAFGYLSAWGGTSKPIAEWLTAQAEALGWRGEGVLAILKSIAAICDPRVNPMALLAASYAVRRLPYMVRAAHAGLEQVSRVYEEAAANLGAKPRRVLWRITAPLLSANLLAGGILCFTFAMLEVSDSLILAQTEAYYPLTKAIYALIDTLERGMNVAAALGVWAMALLAAALIWASALLGKRLGQMFRAG
ncbi:MAG: ABC transporter permease subunit, partial [Planctomycetota bacterium]|nr:ABC transporter permease subunit [Planctomycetota bacterium]